MKRLARRLMGFDADMVRSAAADARTNGAFDLELGLLFFAPGLDGSFWPMMGGKPMHLPTRATPAARRRGCTES